MLDVATESFVGSEIYELVGLYIKSNHSHKKRTNSLEGSLGRALLAAKLEFTKILIPRLPQHTSNVNTECASKSECSKQECSLHVIRFLGH